LPLPRSETGHLFLGGKRTLLLCVDIRPFVRPPRGSLLRAPTAVVRGHRMITLDAISLTSLVTATGLVTLSMVGWRQERSVLIARLFSALALVTAWWTLTRGLATTGLQLRYPVVYISSQLLSGFVGPLLFLLTLAFIRRVRRLRAWWFVILPGTFGTMNVLLVWWTIPVSVQRDSVEAFLAGTSVRDLPYLAHAPWYLPLLAAHTAELFVFMLASVGLFVRYAHVATTSDEVSDARLFTLVYVMALAGVTAADLLPLSGFGSAGPRV